MEDDEASNSAILGDRGLSINNNNPTSSSLTNEIKPMVSLVDMSVILPLYNELSPIASSCNTLVFTAVAQQTKRRVAVKRISLRNCTTISMIKNMLREVKILRRLDHDNVVRISNVVLSTTQNNVSSGSTSPNSLVHPKSSTDTIPASNALELPYDALYLEMELVDIDLYSILSQRKLSPSYVKLFSYQLLRGLKYIHSANVIHRDLTPSNVFINIDTLMLKIGDFGVSRIYDPNYEHTRHLSITTSSTWYQSPEMMITPGHYDRSVDVWAAGCIIAEMCIGTALFPGANALEQMDLICGLVENTEEEWGSVVNLKCSEPDCKTGEVVAPTDGEKCDDEATDLVSKLRSHEVESDLLDLIVLMLQFDPHKRVSVTEALMHPAFDDLRCLYDEPQCNHPFHIEDELDDFSLGKCQELLKLRANELVSVDSSGVDASNDEILRASAKSSIHGSSISHTANKNLLELVRSGSSANPAGSHHDCAMSESEARKMACDFDYGVQIADGSINRERMLMDWRPQSPETACFDPYKWNNDTTTLLKEEDGEKVGEETTVVSPVSHEDDVGGVKVINKQVTDGVQDAASHSDHGYHSSYCSSNLSNGKPIHSHSLWSLSSPDVSIDHEHRATPANSASVTTAIHRAVTPDVEAVAGTTANVSSASSGNINASGVVNQEQEQDQQQSNSSASDHVPSRFQSPTASMDDMEGKRRHKDEVIPHHHQSFHMSYHHHHHHYHHGHHHHHHHHHHHKHHRHSSRHGTSSSQSNLIQRNGGNQQSEVETRVHQRRCLVEDVVQELAEESATTSEHITTTASDSTITPTEQQPQPSSGCKREKRHHHHHRSSKSSSKMTSSQETLKDGSEAGKNEEDFFKREPGYHERLSDEKRGDEAEAMNNNNEQDELSEEVDHPAIMLTFPWMTSNTNAAENAATIADTTTTIASVVSSNVEISQQQVAVSEATADDDLIISSMQEHLQALQISTTAPIPPPPPTPSSCATQSKRVESLELPIGYHRHIAGGSDEQKKAKRRVELLATK